jgi:hypothetical protein
MAAPVLRPLATGEVLDVSFGLYRALFFPLVVVAAVSRAVPLVLSLYMQPGKADADPMATFNLLVDRWPLWLAGILFGLVANAFAVAATTSLVSAAYLGEAIAPGTALIKAAGVIGRVIIVSILTGISWALGAIVLIIPGVVLYCGLALSVVALVLEQPLGPLAAMNRSWELTKGFRWKVFVTMLVAVLFLLIPTMIVGVVAGIGAFVATWPPFVTAILTGVLQVFAYPFLYVVVTVLYYDLRVRKEGYDLELLAATATQSAG